ncbi:hypothetical protein ACOSP7_029246 [Xanthoceras sorbifolium]
MREEWTRQVTDAADGGLKKPCSSDTQLLSQFVCSYGLGLDNKWADLVTIIRPFIVIEGPGSNTSARVTWSGYRVINSSTETSQFTVEGFLQGSEWLNATGIPFFLNLS